MPLSYLLYAYIHKYIVNMETNKYSKSNKDGKYVIINLHNIQLYNHCSTMYKKSKLIRHIPVYSIIPISRHTKIYNYVCVHALFHLFDLYFFSL